MKLTPRGERVELLLCILVTLLLGLWIGHLVTNTGERAPDQLPVEEYDCTLLETNAICGYTQDGEPIRWT